MKKRLAILGNGMAAARLLDELLRRNASRLFDIAVYGEELQPCYNRILLGRILTGGTVDEITIKTKDWYAGRGIALHSGIKIAALNAGTKTLTTAAGDEHPFDTAVWATGSAAVVPELDNLRDDAGALKPGVFVFRTVADCERIRDAAMPASSAVVLGGGLLGLEAAKALCDRGVHVTIVHQAETLMNHQVDERGGKFLRAAVERAGMFVRTGAHAEAVVGEDRVCGLRLKTGEVLSADFLVLACGVRPRVEAALASGVPVNRGILVNDLMATALPGVFAVGECAEHEGRVYGIVPPIWDQCTVLADILSGANPTSRYRGSKLYTRLKVAGVEVASMGVTETTSSNDEVIQILETRRGIYRKLIIRDDKLIGAILVGECDTAPTLARWFDRGDSVPANRLDLFCSPEAYSAPAGEREICTCRHVTETTIRAAIQGGCTSLPQIAEKTEAGTGCGSCRGQLTRLLLQQTPRVLP